MRFPGPQRDVIPVPPDACFPLHTRLSSVMQKQTAACRHCLQLKVMYCTSPLSLNYPTQRELHKDNAYGMHPFTKLPGETKATLASKNPPLFSANTPPTPFIPTLTAAPLSAMVSSQAAHFIVSFSHLIQPQRESV